MLCDKTKRCNAGIFIPHKRAITLVFYTQNTGTELSDTTDCRIPC